MQELPASIFALVRQLGSADPVLRRQAAEALHAEPDWRDGQLWPLDFEAEDAPRLVSAWHRDDDPLVRGCIIDVLGAACIDSPDVVAIVAASLDPACTWVEAATGYAAYRHLRFAGEKPRLRALLRHPSDRVRLGAAMAFRQLPLDYADDAPSVRALLHDAHETVRLQGVAALQRLGLRGPEDRAALHHVVAAGEDGDAARLRAEQMLADGT